MALTNNSFELSGLNQLEDNPPVAVLVRAEIRDGIGMITEIDVEFYDSRTRAPGDEEWDCEAALGKTLGVSVDMEEGGKRWFSGVCIEICQQHKYGGKPFYFASLRAWPWYLTQRTDCRIFQDKTVREIIETSLDDMLTSLPFYMNFRLGGEDTPENQDSPQTPLPRRAFRVQYRESVFDFLYRVMADDGLNFYMDHESDKQTMVVFNALARLRSAPDVEGRTDSVVGFTWHGNRDNDGATDPAEFEGLYEFHRNSRFWSGRAALGDYDPERADVSLEETDRSSTSTMDGAGYDTFEQYDYPGRFVRRQKTASRQDFGPELAAFKMYRLKAAARVDHAAGNTRRIVCGRKFWIGDNTGPGHVARRAVHRLQIDSEQSQSDLRDSLMVRRASLPPLTLPADLAAEEKLERYRVDLELVRVPKGESDVEIPLPEPKRPVIPGIQTATVVGPKEGQVETDDFGRIKVRFHWDRTPEDDENSSCWVRTVMPWTGNGYGALMVPRVGQEVVVQFEEGDPDRPVVAGMLYNSVNTPPDAEAYPQQTSVGIISGSLSGDDLDTPSMLIFDNTAGMEQVLIQAHRNLRQTVMKDMAVDVGGALTIDVEDTTDFDIRKKMTLKVKSLEIEADEEILISVGKEPSIKITKEEIVLKADKIKNNP